MEICLRPINLFLPNNLPSLSHKPQIQNSIIRARNSKRRSVSLRSRQFVLDSMSITSWNRNISPEASSVFARKSGRCNGGINLPLPNRPQARNSITCARKNRRRFGSQRTTRFVLESMSIIASKLNILPEPLNAVIREFGGGIGGGGGGGSSNFWKGFGGGGFDGWRRRKRKLGLLGFLMVSGLLVFFGKRIEGDLFWGFLGFALFGISITVSKIGFQDWFLGFCCCLGLVALGLRRERVEKWVEKFRFCSPLMEAVRRRRRNKWRRAM